MAVLWQILNINVYSRGDEKLVIICFFFRFLCTLFQQSAMSVGFPPMNDVGEIKWQCFNLLVTFSSFSNIHKASLISFAHFATFFQVSSCWIFRDRYFSANRCIASNFPTILELTSSVQVMEVHRPM